jgi:hypothetical protein
MLRQAGLGAGGTRIMPNVALVPEEPEAASSVWQVVARSERLSSGGVGSVRISFVLTFWSSRPHVGIT